MKHSYLMEVLDSCSSDDSARTTNGITTLPSDIMTSHILTKLDAPSLATLSCLQQENLRKDICNHDFPSTTHPLVRDAVSKFPLGGHRSFYFDTFPIHPPHDHHQQSKIIKNIKEEEDGCAPELIYAVDVKFDDRLLYSKVVVTNNRTNGLALPAYRFDLRGRKESFQIPVKVHRGFRDEEESHQVMKTLEEKLKLSWIVIDPTRNKAINLSSHDPVIVNSHCFFGTPTTTGYSISVEYATVIELGGVEASYVVKFDGHHTNRGERGVIWVTEINMEAKGISLREKKVKDVENNDILWEILEEAMKGKRRKQVPIGEKEQRRYRNFLAKRRAAFWQQNLSISSYLPFVLFIFWNLFLFWILYR